MGTRGDELHLALRSSPRASQRTVRVRPHRSARFTPNKLYPPRRFFLNSAHLYETLVRTYSTPPPALSQIHTRNPSCADRECLNERSPLLLTAEAQKHLSDVAGDFVEMEVYLQLSLIKVRRSFRAPPPITSAMQLSGLLDSTKHEPRLKGPFPIATYRSVPLMLHTITTLKRIPQQRPHELPKHPRPPHLYANRHDARSVVHDRPAGFRHSRQPRAARDGSCLPPLPCSTDPRA